MQRHPDVDMNLEFNYQSFLRAINQSQTVRDLDGLMIRYNYLLQTQYQRDQARRLYQDRHARLQRRETLEAFERKQRSAAAERYERTKRKIKAEQEFSITQDLMGFAIGAGTILALNMFLGMF